MTQPDFRAFCRELLDKYDMEWRARERIEDALKATPPPEVAGPSEYEWKDIGDGRPVQVRRCHKCGVCPSNVDDCGHFGDSRCPYFGIDALATPPPEPPSPKPNIDDILSLAHEYFIFRGNSHGDRFFATSIETKTNPAQALLSFARAALERWGK